jgi:hypothetical protein
VKPLRELTRMLGFLSCGKYRGCGTETQFIERKNTERHLFKVTAGGLSEHNTCVREGEMCEHCWRISPYWLPAENTPTVTCPWHVMKRPLSPKLWSKPQQCTTILTIQNQFSNSLPIFVLWYNKFIVHIAFFVSSVHNFYSGHLRACITRLKLPRHKQVLVQLQYCATRAMNQSVYDRLQAFRRDLIAIWVGLRRYLFIRTLSYLYERNKTCIVFLSQTLLNYYFMGYSSTCLLYLSEWPVCKKSVPGQNVLNF